MNNTETFHNKVWVVADTFDFCFKADLFKSVPIIIGFGCHAQHLNASPQEKGCCKKRVFQIRSRPFQSGTDDPKRLLSWTADLQFSTDDPRLLLSWTALRRFAMRRWLLQKPLVSYSEPTFSNPYRSSKALLVVDNIEMFPNQNMVAAETVAFCFEAGLFKSVQITIRVGYRG